MCEREEPALYGKETIGRLRWETKRDGAYAKAYLEPLIKDGVEPYIANIRTTMLALTIDDLVMPVTVNDADYDNAYVCSPYTHYVSYAKEELYLVPAGWQRALLGGVLTMLGRWLRAGRVNKVVCVNNWLLSTNLYHPLTAEQLARITAFLADLYPDHAILFRSVQDGTGGMLPKLLTEAGYKAIMSRQIYVYKPEQDGELPSKHRWILKRDQKLLSACPYTVRRNDEIGDEEVGRIAELYGQLYLDKYSLHNPQFTERFIRLALREHLLSIALLTGGDKAEAAKGGRQAADAVLGYFVRNGVMTTPLFGYDTNVPVEAGLYRLLSAQLVADARQHGLILHQSSGAASFKRCRGARPHVEWNMVYDRHLPARRRQVWAGLQWISEKIGMPLMRRLKL
ncbi:GNAT family N-acetyltransferase [Brevibacillus fluminis]|uniref:GNAT family N-acetyltransferase n=1 Tax=Brevibacillus fluminis TaxID=511487 RepID=UPI003F8C7A0C